jgi:hypothetical protein
MIITLIILVLVLEEILNPCFYGWVHSNGGVYHNKGFNGNMMGYVCFDGEIYHN